MVAWLYSIFWSILPLFSKNQYVIEGFKTSCSFDFIDQSRFTFYLIISMNIFGFIIPLLIIVLCYSYILIHVKKASKFVKIKIFNISTIDEQPRLKRKLNLITTKLTNEESVQKCICLSNKISGKANRKKIDSLINLEWKTTKTVVLLVMIFSITW
jgi:hypothetical protein